MNLPISKQRRTDASVKSYRELMDGREREERTMVVVLASTRQTPPIAFCRAAIIVSVYD